ncbi:MAG: tetratricopeptide repeat protein, partial [Acidobacteria bacterium]|nr:tetratricopeptide repeat protein [Acidobacteriota bacterium]
MTERLLPAKQNAAIPGWKLFCLLWVFTVGFAMCGQMPGQQAVAGPAKTRQEFLQWVARGSHALQVGDNHAAEDAFRRALALDPKSVELLNNLAISIARQGRDDEAISL